MASGPEHYQRAEELLADIAGDDGTVDFGDGGEAYVLSAIGHALLALTAATAMGTDQPVDEMRRWVEVAGIPRVGPRRAARR